MKANPKKKTLPLIRSESRLDIEGRVAGGLIVNGISALKECVSVIAEDFTDPAARQIFETVTALVRDGKPSDELAIMSGINLPSEITLRYVDAAAGLHELGHYATRLHGLAECDRLMQSAGPLVKAGDAVGLSMLLADHAAQMPTGAAALVASDWLQEQDEHIQGIVDGLFDAKNRVAIVSGSKMRKSWFTIQLTFSLVSGKPFLGMAVSGKKRVLLVNGEIDAAAYKKRLRMMLTGACVASEELTGLIIANTSEDSSEWTVGRILAMAKSHRVDVCVIDPFYLLIGDEIDQKAVKESVLEMKRFAASGIALVSVFHATKGMVGDKQAIDRIAGSGIFARDCSTLISLCEHATEPDHVVMTCEIRNHPPRPPATLVFTEGCFHLAEGVAAIEKNSRTKPGRRFDLAVVALAVDVPTSYKDAVDKIRGAQSVGIVKAKELLGQCVVEGLLSIETFGRNTIYTRTDKE